MKRLRRLESRGLLKRGWKSGDRRNYYRTAENLETALQKGMLNFLVQKTQALDAEFREMEEALVGSRQKSRKDHEVNFLLSRIRRTRQLQGRLISFLKSPLIKLLARS